MQQNNNNADHFIETIKVINNNNYNFRAFDLYEKKAYPDSFARELLFNFWNGQKHLVNKYRIENIKEKNTISNAEQFIENSLIEGVDLTEIKGESDAMINVFNLIKKAVKTNINISISGKTGTGKEVVAKCIHLNSKRSKKNFVAINMSAIPKELIESELFGHVKGAFTGAAADKKGKFEEANGGTLFLDEIAEMEIGLQSKILRAIQEKEITRVGCNKAISINVRLITATHKNLLTEVKQGSFREDLYYRIIGLPIDLPALMERGNDIVILTKFFAEKFIEENNIGKIIFTKEAISKLLSYSYPGNVRELKSIIELAIVMCEGNEIKAGDIKIFDTERFSVDAGSSLKTIVKKIISDSLVKNNYDTRAVAKQLNIGRSTIYDMFPNCKEKRFKD